MHLLAAMNSGALAGYVVVYAIVLVLEIAAIWKCFVKAGRPGWAAIIPIYNYYVFIKVAGRPGWWLILFLIPFVNIVIGIIVLLDFAKSFGKGVGYFFGLLLLGFIFFPILGFGNATYVGPAGAR